MRRPADILLLDEPTNDLDIPSLNVLEESLNEFAGALVLVTHDRFMLSRICHQVLGFDGRGKASFFADYEQWLRDITDGKKITRQKDGPEAVPGRKKTEKKTGRLSYMDQREYDRMEEKILTAESRQEELEKIMHDPETVADAEKLHNCWQELETLQENISGLYNRWEELEKIRDGN